MSWREEKKQLIEIAKDTSMPEPVKQMFVNKQLRLIKSVINDIIKTKNHIIKTKRRHKHEVAHV